jgi:hypothetical protein
VEVERAPKVWLVGATVVAMSWSRSDRIGGWGGFRVLGLGV